MVLLTIVCGIVTMLCGVVTMLCGVVTMLCGVVTMLSCWVNTTSRQGIKQLGSIFLLFPYESSRG